MGGFWTNTGTSITMVSDTEGTADVWWIADGTTIRMRTEEGTSASGTAYPPAAGTLAAYDGENGTATLVTTGVGTNLAEFFRTGLTGTDWTYRGSYSGNGSFLFGGTAGAYWFRADVTSSGGTATSNLVFAYISGTTEPKHFAICSEVASRITAAGFVDAGGTAVTGEVDWPPDWTNWEAGVVKVLPDSEAVEPQMTSANETVYGINVIICERTVSGDLSPQLYLRKQIRGLFVGKRLNTNADTYCRGETTSQVYDESSLQQYRFISPLSLEFVVRESR